MIDIITTLLTGTGTAPRNLDVGDTVQFQVTGVSGVEEYWWELVVKPEDSLAYLEKPTQSICRLVGLSVRGNYLVKVLTDRDTPRQKQKTAIVSIPSAISPLPLPPEPQYDNGGRVRNFSFRLPGVLPGYPDDWIVEDEEGVLDDSSAGITRGRIIPTNFETDGDSYVMCLGDDLGADVTYGVNGSFSISQDVNLKDVDILNIDIRFIMR